MPATLTLSHLIRMIWFYSSYGILTIIAYLLNKSFLVLRPGHTFPTVVSPPWNNTIHSLNLTEQMAELIHPRYLHAFPQRRWFAPDRVLHLLPSHEPYSPAIILKGRLSGPPLHEGMILLQQHQVIFIDKEFGRWPTRDNYITTYVISIPTNVSFRLFIPIELMDRCGMYDESPYSPFCRPITFVDTTSRSLRNKSSFNSFESRV